MYMYVNYAPSGRKSKYKSSNLQFVPKWIPDFSFLQLLFDPFFLWTIIISCQFIHLILLVLITHAFISRT